MADYPPPNENLLIFSPSAFSVNDGALTIEDGKKFFLQFPTAQGTENLATTNISGVLTSTNNTHNLGFGYQALLNKVDGSAIDNTAFGFQALSALTLGDSNTAIGDLALQIMTGTSATTSQNTAVGHQAGRFLLTGTNNTFLGYNAGSGTSSHSTSNSNTCVGSKAGQSLTTGDNNNCFGEEAGAGITSGTGNTCFGGFSGKTISTTNTNTAIGESSFFFGTGSDNVMIGNQAGATGTAITSGSRNTFIGTQTQSTSATITNSTSIGYQAQVTASNQIVLGTASETVICRATLQYNKVTPIYTTLPTYTSADIGFIQSATITGPGTTANVIASYTAQAGVWLINLFLALTTTTTLDAIVYENAGVNQGIFTKLSVGGNDYYSGSFITSISTGTAVLRIYPFVSGTTGGVQTGVGGQFCKFTRIA